MLGMTSTAYSMQLWQGDWGGGGQVVSALLKRSD